MMPIVSKKSRLDPKIRWFDKARFGMFIHFGIYSQLGRGEWVMYEEDIPRHEYEKLSQTFNPRNFDAQEWVSLAQEAGARYINFGAKHHDGFCMFDSQLTDFKITNTPFERDLVGELIEACQRSGMPIILYYSQPDWHHPNYLHRKGAFKDLQNPPPDQDPDWPLFQDYIEGQVKELVTNYGKIDGIWFDGSHKSRAEWRGEKLYRMIKSHQPHAVVNDRARFGDFFTPERSLPDDLTDYLFESCQSIQEIHWGFVENTPLYSTPYLLDSLVRMACAGGNYLLNVGPKPDGTIPTEQAKRMREIGRWLEKNGESIYRTKGLKLSSDSNEFLATRKGDKVFIHLMSWPPTDCLKVPGIGTRPEEAHLLGESIRLEVNSSPEGLEISGLPSLPPSIGPWVVSLNFQKEPSISEKKDKPEMEKVHVLEPGPPIRLPARDARLLGRGVKGKTLRLRETEAEQCITFWRALEQRAVWSLNARERMHCQVRVELSCPTTYSGSRFMIKCGENRLEGVVRGTESFDDFEFQEIGELLIPEGESRLTMRPLNMPYGYLFADVRGIELLAENQT